MDYRALNRIPSDARKVKGELHATTSTGGEVVLYEAGTGTAYTMTASDRLVVTAAYVAASVTGDTILYLDTDDGNDADAGEVVLRATLANNGQMSMDFSGDPIIGGKGGKPHVICASGTIDVIITGWVKTERS